MDRSALLQRSQWLMAFAMPAFAPGKEEIWSRMAEAAACEKDSGQFVKVISERVTSSDDLEAEFNRLSMGPYRRVVSPYETIWAGTKSINTRITAVVAWFYAQVGLAVDTHFNEPADFIGNEMQFLGAVYSLAAEHRRLGQDEIADGLEEFARIFWAEHLGHWAGGYFGSVAKNTSAPELAAWAQHTKKGLEALFAGVELTEMKTGVEKKSASETIPINVQQDLS